MIQSNCFTCHCALLCVIMYHYFYFIAFIYVLLNCQVKYNLLNMLQYIRLFGSVPVTVGDKHHDLKTIHVFEFVYG